MLRGSCGGGVGCLVFISGFARAGSVFGWRRPRAVRPDSTLAAKMQNAPRLFFMFRRGKGRPGRRVDGWMAGDFAKLVCNP